MAYKVRRGKSESSKNAIKETIQSMGVYAVSVVVIVASIGFIGYLLFNWAYHEYPPFAESADSVIQWIEGFYNKFGIWKTLVLIVAVVIGVWAIGEESKRKERRKEAMKEFTK